MPNIVFKAGLMSNDSRSGRRSVGRILRGANLVLVANDEVAEDPVQQNLMEMVLAEGIAVRFWTLQKLSTTFIAPPIDKENPCWFVNTRRFPDAGERWRSGESH